MKIIEDGFCNHFNTPYRNCNSDLSRNNIADQNGINCTNDSPGDRFQKTFNGFVSSVTDFNDSVFWLLFFVVADKYIKHRYGFLVENKCKPDAGRDNWRLCLKKIGINTYHRICK